MNTIVVLCACIPNPRMSRRIKTLSTTGDKIVVLCWERTHGFYPGADKQENVEYVFLKSRKINNLSKRIVDTLFLSYKTVMLIKNYKPKLLYIFDIECVLAAAIYKKRHKTTLLLEISDLPATMLVYKHKMLGFIANIIIENLISKANAIVVTSPYYYNNYYKYRTNINSEDVFVFENVPPREVFFNFKKEKHGSFVIGFVGGVRYIESIKALLEATSIIEGVEVVIAGDGPDLEILKDDSIKYSNVYFSGGYNYNNEIAKIYSKIDLIYAVYDSNIFNVNLALPNKLYEAIVCEIPIIVAKGTCLEKYVLEKGIGFSVPYGDVFELRNLLKDLLKDTNRLQICSNNGKKISHLYIYERYELLFKKWLSRYR